MIGQTGGHCGRHAVRAVDVAEFEMRSEPGNWRTPPVQRLTLALKVLLRGFGLRCIECRPCVRGGRHQ